jgi:translocation and assembly module TamB
MSRVTLGETGFQKRPARRWKRRHSVAVALMGFVLALFFAVPWLLQNRDFAVSMINRYAGIGPMRVDLKGIQVGWFRPIILDGLRLVDDRGADLIRVGEVRTQLSLFSLITNCKRLGTIEIRDAAIALDVQPGTTNIEEAFKPWWVDAPTQEAKPGSRGSEFTGRILLANAVLYARDSVDLTAWEIKFEEADIPLPTAEQAFPPMTLVGKLVQTQALPGEIPVGGQFLIRTQSVSRHPDGVGSQESPALRMSVATQNMPLQWMSLIKRRLPDVPIERVTGQATVQAEVEFLSRASMMANIQTAQVDHLMVVSPELFGSRGAQFEQIKISGDLHMTPTRLSTRGSKLDCDIGSVIAKADFAWPIQMPSLTKPWFEDADLDIQGSIDLPRLSRVAPDVIRTQDQVELISGVATLSAVQRRAAPSASGLATPPATSARVELGQLQAKVQGNTISWDQALRASIQVQGSEKDLPSFQLACDSEFCKMDGSGEPRDGRLTAQLDFDKMEQRLSQWFVLPFDSLRGSAQGALTWKVDEGNRLVAGGSLRTTPLRIAHGKGQIDEPAWDGEFTSISRLDGFTLLQIDRAQVTLKSSDESCSVQLLEPLALTASAPGQPKLPPASMQIQLVGELQRWQRRVQMFGGIDPGFTMAGTCNMEAHGGVDLEHVEITKADWNLEPIQVTTSSMAIQEARLVGKFAGRFDTSDIAKTQVDTLLVQSASFALQAQDAAVPGKMSARDGQAAFRLAPDRLMSSVRWESGDGNPQPSSLRVTGDITGQIHWTIDPAMIRWQLVSDAAQLRAVQPGTRLPGQLVSTASVNQEDQVLWEEPQAKLLVDGDYSIADGTTNLSKLQLQTEWLAYAGQASIQQRVDQTSIVSEGSITYDAASAAQRLRPYIGDLVTIEGQRTQALDISWSSHPTHPWARSLQATSSVGWDSANVIGIEIGKGEIPIEIRNGLFVSKASFPVSQGTLRWNLEGDIAGEPLAIRQSQERVIENVAITREMCQRWLKYVAPLLADATSVQGNLSLDIAKAEIIPSDWTKQTAIGQVYVHGAAVGPGPMADQILALVQQIRSLRKGAGATDGGGQPTSWLQLPEQNIGFEVNQGRVAHRGLQIQAGDVAIWTSGSVGVDGTLEMVASVPIQKDWLDKAPALQSLAGQQFQIPIRGTISRPQLDLGSLAGMTQNLATAALQSAAQKQIDRGLNKILGPLEKQLGPLQQGMQQMQQGVQQNLPQLPLPNLPIPGFGGGVFGGAQSQPSQPPVQGPPALPPPPG